MLGGAAFVSPFELDAAFKYFKGLNVEAANICEKIAVNCVYRRLLHGFVLYVGVTVCECGGR